MKFPSIYSTYVIVSCSAVCLFLILPVCFSSVRPSVLSCVKKSKSKYRFVRYSGDTISHRITDVDRNELWFMHWCLENNVGRVGGGQLQRWIKKRGGERVRRMASYSTIMKRLKEGYHYPDVLGSGTLKNSHTFTVPDGFHGNASNITFRYGSVLHTACSILNDSTLHNNKQENFIWDAYDKGSEERVYDSELASGDWWFRNSTSLLHEKKILALIPYTDETFLTGSGSQLAHPIMLSIGNLRKEIRQKDRAMRMVGLIPILNPTRLNEYIFITYMVHMVLY